MTTNSKLIKALAKDFERKEKAKIKLANHLQELRYSLPRRMPKRDLNKLVKYLGILVPEFEQK
jgi:hypothetical protein